MSDKTILVIGTYDTKDDELEFLSGVIREQGGRVLSMDVSVLGDPSKPTDYSKLSVAQEGGSLIQAAIASGDENHAMQIMAKGAAMLTARLYAEGKFDGMIVLGGTMGTDLALDVASALPLGVPKYVVSTVSFSPLIPAERLAADTQMIRGALWAQFGLQSVTQSGGGRRSGRGACRRPAELKKAVDWHDLAGQIGIEIHGAAQTRTRSAWVRSRGFPCNRNGWARIRKPRCTRRVCLRF